MKPVRALALVAAAVVWASVVAPAPATATAPVGTEAVTISQATVDGIDYIAREITIAPGGSTGWHYHDGRVFGVVRAGTLTRTMADCTDVVSEAGAPVVEDSGRGHVHVGRNLGPEPVVLWIDYIQPTGAPLSVAAPDPGCGFA
ncbi:cupin domain-containing protein [Mycolicibacterium sp. XJ1819]